MKTILCYGDSLTWGASPIQNGPRHGFEDRWPAALEAGLGGKARCIAEGLGGRTTVHDDWYTAADRNGARILPTLLASHWPLDMVIVMLGTNDIKHMLGRTALEASYGVRRLVDVVRAYAATENVPPPNIILVAPPGVVAATAHPEMTLHFGLDGITDSVNFAKWYKLRAEEEGVGFFDAGSVAATSPLDGIHLDAANTRAIGSGLVPLVTQMLGL
ncbi:MAG: SGNH/GDSL hydrolase family protein [Devosia sp.]